MNPFSENRFSQQQEIAPLRICIFIFSIFPFLGIGGIEKTLGETIRQAWQIAGVGLLFVELVLQNLVKWDDYIVYFAMEQLFILFVTTMKSKFLMGLLITTLANILIALLIRNDRVNFLYAISVCMIIVVVCNAFSMLRTGTGGFNKVYFIGGKNALSIVLVPGSFVIYLLEQEIEEQAKRLDGYARYRMADTALFLKRIFYVYSIIAIGSIFYGRSGTGIIMSLITLVTLLAVDRISINKRLIFMGLSVIYGVILFGDAIFTSDLWIDFTTALDKDPTLTYRTVVWAGAMKTFKKNLMMGIGKVFCLPFVDNFGVQRAVSEAHNFLLQILCSGGLIDLFLNYSILRHSIARLDPRNRRQKIVFVCYALILVNGFTESVNYKFFSILIPALANSYLADMEPQRIAPSPNSGRRKDNIG